MGEVVKERRFFWQGVERTQTGRDYTQPVIIAQVSLDVLAEQVRAANNAWVMANAEADKRLRHLELCRQALANRMFEVAQISGIKEIKFKALPQREDEE